MKKKKILAGIFDLILLSLLIGLDQLTKMIAVSRLKNQSPFVLIQDVLQFRYLENRGAAFGMLQNQKWFFLVIGIVFLIIITVALIRIPVNRKYCILRVCLIFIAAGAVGNMIDRVLYEYVIDFIYFEYINFPIFNVADCYVSVSTVLLIILILFYYKEDDLNLKKAGKVKIHSSMYEGKSNQQDEGK